MQQIIPLTDGRSLIAAFSTPRRKSRKWVVFLTESGAGFQDGSRTELKHLLGADLAAKFNYLVVNKPGLGPRKVDKEAFEESFRRRRRVEDALATLASVIPQQDKICLVGYSEGAYLAPEIACRDARIESVVIIGGGTRGWLKEELSHATSSRERAALLRQVERIRQDGLSSREKWNGFSYATWHSYRADSTLKALGRLKVPVLSILGQRDRVIDLTATLKDLQRLARHRNIRTQLLKNCGHSFANHWPAVRREVRAFLTRS